jgi:hypothetical protein
LQSRYSVDAEHPLGIADTSLIRAACVRPNADVQWDAASLEYDQRGIVGTVKVIAAKPFDHLRPVKLHLLISSSCSYLDRTGNTVVSQTAVINR